MSLKSIIAWIIGCSLAIVVSAAVFIPYASYEINKPWLSYEIEIPETDCTHVKITIHHHEPGSFWEEAHKYKIMKIPENRTFIYETQFTGIKHIYATFEFYNKMGSGYVHSHTERVSIDY